MPRAETLSIQEARHLMLAAQGLAQAPGRAARKRDVLASIRRMGLLQIDSINVVARSPYLVLWSRLGAFDRGELDRLLWAEGQLFEWNALIWPIESLPMVRAWMRPR